MKYLKTIIVMIAVMLFLEVPTAEAVTVGQVLEAREDEKAVLAAVMEADITELRGAIDAGLLSCTELTAFYLERIGRYNEEYNCFITICGDAMARAEEKDELLKSGDARGKLFGIPVVIKDNIDYEGWITTNGYSGKKQTAQDSAEIVQYLLNEGAIIIGKTNMSTGAQEARSCTSKAVGETKNAYNRYLSSGGSSGGSATAVSLNFASAGLGTDTNSSLRYPAVLNGCISLRSTTGTISMDGIARLNRTRDIPGVITRSVEDQALMLDVISAGTTNYFENLDQTVLKGLKIGILEQLTYPQNSAPAEEGIDDEVMAAFEKAVTELESCGAEVVEVSVPDLLYLSSRTLRSNAESHKVKMYKAVEEAMVKAGVSALIFPTYLNTPLRSGEDENGNYWSIYTQDYINNCRELSPATGMPEIALPIGCHSLGAGMGIEIAALKGQEQLLLDIAYSYTENFNHRKIPDSAENIYRESFVMNIEELLSIFGGNITEADTDDGQQILRHIEDRYSPPAMVVEFVENSDEKTEDIPEKILDPEENELWWNDERQRQEQSRYLKETAVLATTLLAVFAVVYSIFGIKNAKRDIESKSSEKQVK